MKRPFGPLVLCYHAVSKDFEHDMFISPRRLAEQVRWLLRRGFRPATAAETLDGRSRIVHVTFDDAYRNVAGALPELERLRVPVTVFACTDAADAGTSLSVSELSTATAQHPDEFSVMSWDELRGLDARRVEVGSHTCSHPHLPRLTDAELGRELRDSKGRLEDELSRPCRFLAYPYGEHDGRVRMAARRAGYEGAFGLVARRRPADLHAIPRVDLYRGDGLLRATLKTSFVKRSLTDGLRRRDSSFDAT